MYAAGVERRVVVKGKNDKNSNKQSGHCGPTLHQRPKWMAARMAVHYVDTWLYVCRYGTERELSIPLSTAIPVLQRTHTSISNSKSFNSYTAGNNTARPLYRENQLGLLKTNTVPMNQ